MASKELLIRGFLSVAGRVFWTELTQASVMSEDYFLRCRHYVTIYVSRSTLSPFTECRRHCHLLSHALYIVTLYEIPSTLSHFTGCPLHCHLLRDALYTVTFYEMLSTLSPFTGCPLHCHLLRDARYTVTF